MLEVISWISALTIYATTSLFSASYIEPQYQVWCYELGSEYDVPAELLIALIESESSGNPDAQNGNCKGLCQVNQKWHTDRMEYLDVEDITDPYGNILVAVDYLNEIRWDVGEDWAYVLDIYNGNSKAKFYSDNGIVSTYANKILDRATEIESFYCVARAGEEIVNE